MQEHGNFEYIQIHPHNALSFPYTPKRYLNSSIHLTNTTSQLVAFKIRTNSPFAYLVKPCTGIILPHHSTAIDITMQPTDYDHTTVLTDKFLINACILPEKTYSSSMNEAVYLREIFKIIPPSQLQTHKLKVDLKFESIDSGEENLHTRDTSAHESSPSKEDVSENSEKGDQSFQTILSEGLEKSGNEKENTELCLDEPKESLSLVRGIVKSQSLTNINTKSLLEQVKMMEKQNSSNCEGSRNLGSTSRRKKLLEMEEHQKVISEVIEERNQLRQHLENIKKASLCESAEAKTSQMKIKGEYHFWHIILVALVGLILGALLK